MPILFDLVSVHTQTKLPPLLELPDDAPQQLAELVDQRLALGQLDGGADYMLVPLDQSPAQSRLQQLHFVLQRLDEPNRKLYVLQTLLDGVVDRADSLFKPYKVVVITDLRTDLQALINYHAGKTPDYRPTYAHRQPLGELVNFLQEDSPPPPSDD